MPTSSVSGDSHGAPPKYRMVHTLAGVSCTDHNHSRTGAITHNSNHGNSNRHNSSSSTMLLHHRCSRLPSGHHSSFPPVTFPTTIWEDGALCSIVPPTQAKQLTVSSGNRGQSTEGPSEGSCATDWPCQLHHHGGDPHGRRSTNGYVLPQRTYYCYTVRFWSIT
jgi:hypothetical protein